MRLTHLETRNELRGTVLHVRLYVCVNVCMFNPKTDIVVEQRRFLSGEHREFAGVLEGMRLGSVNCSSRRFRNCVNFAYGDYRRRSRNRESWMVIRLRQSLVDQIEIAQDDCSS